MKRLYKVAMVMAMAGLLLLLAVIGAGVSYPCLLYTSVLAFQLFRMEGFPEGKGVIGGTGQHKLIFDYRQRAQIGAFHRSFHQGHIQLAFQQHFFNKPGVVYKDLHLGQGKQLFIPVDDGGEEDVYKRQPQDSGMSCAGRCTPRPMPSFLPSAVT